MLTCVAPASLNMKGATSPVCAPSSTSVEQFCPATRMLDPSSRSATVLSAVNTGAITTSQWLALATSGLSARAVSTDSPTVLYIFQFPAITGLRIDVWIYGLWFLDFGLCSSILFGTHYQ